MRFLFICLTLLIFPASAHAAWVKGESRHFIGYSDGKEAELRTDLIQLEKFDALMRKRLGISDDGGQAKLTVFFVRNASLVRRAMGGGSGSRGVAGFYTTSSEGALAVVPRVIGQGSKFDLDGDTVLYHEYAHHLMFQYFQAAYPSWYVEGFAEFMSTTTFDEKSGKANIGMPAYHRAYGLALGPSIPLKRLLTAQSGDMGSTERDPFYGRSWFLVHFLSFNLARRGQLQTYLQLVADGKPSLAAGEQAFGDLAIMSAEFNRYMQQRKMAYLPVDAVAVSADNIRISTLSEGESEAMPHRITAMRGVSPEEGVANAKALRAIARRYPGDAALLTALAEAEHDASDYPAAVATADKALALDPGSARAMLWKGRAMMLQLADAKDRDEVKWKAARGWIVKANRANPEYATPLLSYYESFMREGRTPPPLAIDGVRKALTLVPQSSDLRLGLVRALIGQRNYKEARQFLAVLANAPHDGGYAGYARKLVERLNATPADADPSWLEAFDKEQANAGEAE
jgi:tetratricopeptide (TPR) repeat protein